MSTAYSFKYTRSVILLLSEMLNEILNLDDLRLTQFNSVTLDIKIPLIVGTYLLYIAASFHDSLSCLPSYG